jgi:hypothetical protein
VDDARKAALKATRGVDIGKGYYKEVSDDATIPDLIDVISDVNSVNELRNSWSNLKKDKGKDRIIFKATIKMRTTITLKMT